MDSVGIFSRESLKTYTKTRKDALYDAMNCENWRCHLHLEVAKKTKVALKTTDKCSAFALSACFGADVRECRSRWPDDGCFGFNYSCNCC